VCGPEKLGQDKNIRAVGRKNNVVSKERALGSVGALRKRKKTTLDALVRNRVSRRARGSAPIMGTLKKHDDGISVCKLH
jgi:hypothetical protein